MEDARADADVSDDEPPHMAVEVVPLSSDHVLRASSWRYEGRFAVYDGESDDPISAEKGYHAIVERRTGRFLGFVCVGEDARVPGISEIADVADVGFGLTASIVGRGLGRSIVGPALEWVERRVDASHLRALVQTWNLRSRRLCESLGFTEVGSHVVLHDGEMVDYVVLQRPIPSQQSPALGPDA